MEEKFRKAVLLMSVPAVINVMVTVYCYFRFEFTQFAGYLTGTVLGIIFSVLWLWMIRKVSVSNPFKLFKVTLGLFPVKLLVLVIVAFVSAFFINVDQFFFGISFLLATVLTLIVEVRFILEFNRLYRERKKN